MGIKDIYRVIICIKCFNCYRLREFRLGGVIFLINVCGRVKIWFWFLKLNKVCKYFDGD